MLVEARGRMRQWNFQNRKQRAGESGDEKGRLNDLRSAIALPRRFSVITVPLGTYLVY